MSVLHDPTWSLLVARGVSKSFGAVQALIDVDLDVDADEVVGSELREPGLRRLKRSLDETAMERRTRELLASLLGVATFDRRTTAREDVVAAITGARPAEAVAA
jgi:hypothetical protein